MSPTDEADPAATPLPATRVGGAEPLIVLLHGFTQTRESWAGIVGRLPDQRLVLPDLPGHGAASHDDASLAEAAGLVADTAGPAVYVGYSMGGRVALRLALDRPDVVSGLVLVGATAGIDDPGERFERRESDAALADRIESIGTDAFLRGWLAQPLFAGLDADPADLAARRSNRPEALAASLRHAGTGSMDPPWWQDVSAISAPTLVLAGDRDAKFTALGRRLAGAIGPNADFEPIVDAGHAAHLEQPDAFAARLARFVAGLR